MSALTPDTETVTPEDEIIDLNLTQREQRLECLIGQALQIVKDAERIHLGDHELTARVVLFSGGNDSTVLAHLMRREGVVSHFAHANTTIGVEETRQFVRDTCAKWGMPLLEKFPEETYRELVVAHGFPGPGHHYKMYQRLKERCLRQVRRDFVTNPRRQRVLLIAGRRRSESARRSGFRGDKMAVPLHEREGSTIWASPLAMWTKHDMLTYRARMNALEDPVPLNRVSDALGMSGECLCGAFAQLGELSRVRLWFPETAAEIDEIAAAVAEAGWTEPHNRWGHGSKGMSIRPRSGRLCSSCDDRYGETTEPVEQTG